MENVEFFCVTDANSFDYNDRECVFPSVLNLIYAVNNFAHLHLTANINISYKRTVILACNTFSLKMFILRQLLRKY